MTNNKLKVSLGYNQYPGSVLDALTTAIVTAMTGDAAFPAPTIPLATITTRQKAFRTILAAASSGGTQFTAEKNQTRQLLLDALDANVLFMYVQALARYDLAMLLSLSNQAASTNRAQTSLPAPVILPPDKDMSTQLMLRLSPITNAYCYEVQISIGTGAWEPARSNTAERKIILTYLMSGTIQNVQARAIGGSTGYSDRSDPNSHMAT